MSTSAIASSIDALAPGSALAGSVPGSSWPSTPNVMLQLAQKPGRRASSSRIAAKTGPSLRGLGSAPIAMRPCASR
jgi:hypothetical protein